MPTSLNSITLRWIVDVGAAANYQIKLSFVTQPPTLLFIVIEMYGIYGMLYRKINKPLKTGLAINKTDKQIKI